MLKVSVQVPKDTEVTLNRALFREFDEEAIYKSIDKCDGNQQRVKYPQG